MINVGGGCNETRRPGGDVMDGAVDNEVALDFFDVVVDAMMGAEDNEVAGDLVVGAIFGADDSDVDDLLDDVLDVATLDFLMGNVVGTGA